jgi:uncharacterized protein YjgD (DUF1641 family)
MFSATSPNNAIFQSSLEKIFIDADMKVKLQESKSVSQLRKNEIAQRLREEWKSEENKRNISQMMESFNTYYTEMKTVATASNVSSSTTLANQRERIQMIVNVVRSLPTEDNKTNTEFTMTVVKNALNQNQLTYDDFMNCIINGMNKNVLNTMQVNSQSSLLASIRNMNIAADCIDIYEISKWMNRIINSFELYNFRRQSKKYEMGPQNIETFATIQTMKKKYPHSFAGGSNNRKTKKDVPVSKNNTRRKRP